MAEAPSEHKAAIRNLPRNVRAVSAASFFMDVSGEMVQNILTQRYGRAAPDQRVVDHVPQPTGPQITTLAVIGLAGITAPLALSGAVNCGYAIT